MVGRQVVSRDAGDAVVTTHVGDGQRDESSDREDAGREAIVHGGRTSGLAAMLDQGVGVMRSSPVGRSSSASPRTIVSGTSPHRSDRSWPGQLGRGEAVSVHEQTHDAVGTRVRFEEWFDAGEMRFDYRLKPGRVTRSNALALMRAVGLEVDADG